MLFHRDDVDGVTQQRALCTSKATVDDDSSNGERNAYLAAVMSMKRFQLGVRLVALSDSLRSVSR